MPSQLQVFEVECRFKRSVAAGNHIAVAPRRLLILAESAQDPNLPKIVADVLGQRPGFEIVIGFAKLICAGVWAEVPTPDEPESVPTKQNSEVR